MVTVFHTGMGEDDDEAEEEEEGAGTFWTCTGPRTFGAGVGVYMHTDPTRISSSIRTHSCGLAFTRSVDLSNVQTSDSHPL